MKTYRIAAIPGDGIGNEVIPAGVEVLQALSSKEGFSIKTVDFDWSSRRYLETGAYIPAGGLDELKKF
ncbi:MAG TPA: isocitrate/isopropylmalate family dehydrogenase, partial [Burkholderiales bacterium]|nr:isocitrate/isopropylmalate family dehydrogenase [Burkholderiales bacterium]